MKNIELEIYEVVTTGEKAKKTQCSRDLPNGGVDEVRKAAKKMLTDMGYKIRSINFTTNNKLRAIVSKDRQTTSHTLGGRVYKRPLNSQMVKRK